jgi:dTDP-4-amino-4,6-dideoxygalactose transaminase
MMKNSLEDFAAFGGSPVFDSVKTTMNLPRPDKEMFLRELKNSVDQHKITGVGPQLLQLEEKLAEFHETKYCVAFCNCFFAMAITLRELALPGKNEVVVPSLTYRRMSDIIIWAGLTPRFCDVDEHTLGVTAEAAELCVNENTAIILAPHPISNLCDIDGMIALAKRHGLPILFDAVEANGGFYKGKKIGSFGDAESFSLHPSKIINGAEGGYITTDNGQLARSLRQHRNYGMNDTGDVAGPGCNAGLNEMHAALALASFSILDQLIESNKIHHLEYQKSIEGISGLRVVEFPVTDKRNWKSVLVELEDDWPLTREQTLIVLNQEKIWARAYYSPAQHTSAKKQAGEKELPLPVTDRMVDRFMLLPFGYTVSIEDIHKIGSVLSAMRDHGDTIKTGFRDGEES